MYETHLNDDEEKLEKERRRFFFDVVRKRTVKSIMVRTRSKRRGDVVKSSSPISHEEDIVNTRLALEEAERTRSRLAKKRRIESWVRNHPPFEILPTELLPTIMLFLDSARDVYNLSLCSKSLRRAVTPEIVVRSAVFQGGRAK